MTRSKKSSRRNQARPPTVTPPPSAPSVVPPHKPLTESHTHVTFPIVGIGSSAGGLEALEEFFRHLPVNPGAAFVVVTHQQAGHSSLLPEILRRWTALPVVDASDGLTLKLNTIYLPPPAIDWPSSMASCI